MGKCGVLGLGISLLLAAGGTGCLPKYSGATVNFADVAAGTGGFKLVGEALGVSARTLAPTGSWAKVAEAAGTSRQAAWSRWSS